MKMLLILGLFWGITLGAPVSEDTEQQSMYWYEWEAGLQRIQEEGKFALLLIAREDCTLTDHYLQSSFSTKRVLEIVGDRFVPIHMKDIPSSIQSVPPILNFTKKSAGLPKTVEKLMSDKNLQSPTLVVLDKDLKVLQSFSGYLKAELLAEILEYYGKDHYKKTPWETFHRAH